MKLALALLSLVALNSYSAHAQTANSQCGAALSKVNYPATQELWRGLTKNSHDLLAVTETLHENQKLMEEAAQDGKPFEFVRKEAAKNGFPFGSQNIPYYERKYLKIFIAKNCDEVTLEAGDSSNPAVVQERFSDPSPTLSGNKINDLTRGLGSGSGSDTPEGVQ